MSCPPFSLTKSRYDADTFAGRCAYFYEFTDMRTLLTTDAELERCKKLLADYKAGTLPPGTTDEDLWNARRIKEAMVHSDTGETIFAPFRFAAFTPMNLGIVALMQLPGTVSSVYGTIGIHWLNQTYNAGQNYANRNASNPVPTRLLAEAYCGAVATSVSIALGATYALKRVPKTGGLALAVSTILPWFAVAGAGAANVALIRRNELVTGVDVSDSEGKVHGKSVAAGTLGLSKCAMARIIWNTPIMVFPPLVMSVLGPKIPNPRMRMAVNMGILTSVLINCVPPALAAFPQRDKVAVASLEKEFHNLKDSKGQPITHLYYNKGL